MTKVIDQKTGLGKVCTKCGIEKSVSDFYKHKGGRHGVDSVCKDCAKAKSKNWRAENPDRVAETKRIYNETNREAIRKAERDKYRENIEEERAARKKYYHDNLERERTKSRENARKRTDRKERAKAYYEENREEILRKKAEERENNPEKVLAYARDAMKRKLSTPQGRLESSMRTYVCKSLKTGVKGGRRTFELLGYTSSDLKKHLERLFLQGMTWENYGRGRGKWNIDHIRPVSSFQYDDVDDEDFKLCWALDNLRPMWSIDNIKKGAKWTSADNDNNTVPKRTEHD